MKGLLQIHRVYEKYGHFSSQLERTLDKKVELSKKIK